MRACVRACVRACARTYVRTYITPIVHTRREPVQRAVERDGIPYPYKVHDTTLRPLLNISRKSIVVQL